MCNLVTIIVLYKFYSELAIIHFTQLIIENQSKVYFISKTTMTQQLKYPFTFVVNNKIPFNFNSEI